ncbi:MAG TPA: PKD domain-containing protein [Candidatus Paceibacterota bacterium]
MALVSAFIIQPLTPFIALADEGSASVGQTWSYSNPGQDNWTVPSNVTSIKVKVWGAGAAGGSGEKIEESHRSGQGGGAGGYSEKTISVNSGDSFSIAIGAGGQGIMSYYDGRVGNPGGDSSFSGSFGTMTANGGQGGQSFMGHGNPTGDMGFGGQANGGDINVAGQSGAPYTEYDGGPYASNGGSAYNGGQGGSRGRCGNDGACPGSHLGSPWATNGGFPGGGGGGSDVGQGGFGANGQVTIEVVSVVSVPQTPVSPIGFIDGASCDVITGWTYDPDNSSVSNGVHFYTDNNVLIGNTEADQPRQDVNDANGVSGNHGFSFPTPASLKDGQTHNIYAYGLNTNGAGENAILSGSPKQITGCTTDGGSGGPGPILNLPPHAPTVTPTSGSGAANVSHTFTANTTDPEGDNVDYGFDWNNDGNVDFYSGLVPSGTSAQMSYSWSAAGTYPVRVVVRDSNLNYSAETVVPFVVTSTGGGGGNTNTAPNLPNLLSAPLTGPINTPIQFSVVATDPQNDNISYGFDWNNNGQNIEYTALTMSGISAEISHSWPAAGTYTFSVRARDAQGAISAPISHTITISGTTGGNNNPPVANITSFYVNPTAITSGEMATLHWTSANATYCEASGDWSGAQATAGSFALGAQTASVTTNKFFTLSCGNANGTSTLSATLTINPTTGGGNGGNNNPSIGQFQITPNPIVSGNGATITWSSTNATLCVASGSWSGNLATSGSAPIAPITVSATTNYTYTLSCGNSNSTTTQNQILTVNPTTGGPGGPGNPTIDFTVSPQSGLITTESGNTASFAVALASAPTANVTLPINSSNWNEGTTSVSSLVFTPANWNLPQDVVVTGRDDGAVDGNVSYMITVGASASSQAAWNNLPAKTVSVTNTDNDTSNGGGNNGGGGSDGSGVVPPRGGGGGGNSGTCVGYGCTTGGGNGGSNNPDITIIFDNPTTSTGGGSTVSGPELVCPAVNFITVFMKKGIDNNPNEVRKLQYFLNSYEGANLTVNGQFDDATEAAVKALQAGHATEILAPWGVTEATGIVYITTARYINTTFCNDNPGYTGDQDVKDILDNNVPYVPVDNSGEFDGAIGQATSTPTNIAGAFGAFTQRVWDFLKDIPWYQILILLLLLIGTAFTVHGIFRKDIGSHDYFMSFIQGASALAVGSVLNVLNAMSFILNPDWFTDKAGFGLGWLLALGIVNLLAFVVICVAILLALYNRVTVKSTTRPL